MKFFDLLSKLDAQARFLGLTTTLLALCLLFMTLTVFFLYSKKTVIVLPPKVDKEFWVSGDTLSTTYLEQVAYFIADRVLSVSPHNVESSLSTIKPFFSTNPEDVENLDKVFVNLVKTVKENDYYQMFYPLRFYAEKDKLVVDGILRKMSGMQYIGEERKSVVIYYFVNNGRFFVKGIEVK